MKLITITMFLIAIIGFSGLDRATYGSLLTWTWFRVAGWVLVLLPWAVYFFVDRKLTKSEFRSK